MPSTYSANLRLELQATGENANTWGTKTNNNLNLLGDAISGYLAVALTDGTNALTANDGTADQTRQASLEFTGTLSTSAVAQVPGGIEGRWIVRNSCTGGNVTFRVSGGTGVPLPAGESILVYSDGVSVWSVTPAITSISASYIYGNKIVTPELSAVNANVSILVANTAQVSAAAITSLTVSVVSAAQVFAVSVSAGDILGQRITTSALSTQTFSTSAAQISSVLYTGGATSATGYTSAGSVVLPATAAVRSLNTPKAWVNFNGLTGTIRAAFNVSAVTRNSTGYYTIKFIEPFTSAGYVMAGSCFTEGNDSQGIQPYNASAFTVSTADVLTINNGGTGGGGDPFDATLATAIFYGV